MVVRYLKKARPRRDLHMFNTYFYSKLEEALSMPVWFLCFIAILILSKLKKYHALPQLDTMHCFALVGLIVPAERTLIAFSHF